tara:strand:- start:30172 stop:30834 length:663 start_codon:yes stop_codon:yes gene_type:complete
MMLLYNYYPSDEGRPKKISLKKLNKPQAVCIIASNGSSAQTVSKCKTYYPDFDVIVAGYKKNDFLEAWANAYSRNKSKYNIFMFLDRNLVPNKSPKLNYDGILNSDLAYSLNYSTIFGKFRYDKKNVDKQATDKIRDLYGGSDLQHIADFDSNQMVEASHKSFFIANSKITEEVLKLQKPYKKRKQEKTALDYIILEKTVGLVLKKHAKTTISLVSKFEL